ncbi:hypothetical protein CCP3SC15_920009 [Gammaproteobacteria bacterium]
MSVYFGRKNGFDKSGFWRAKRQGRIENERENQETLIVSTLSHLALSTREC